MGSRIINVVDAYQTMRSNRAYRKIFSKEKAIAELKKSAGTQFDPEIVRVFVGILLNETLIWEEFSYRRAKEKVEYPEIQQ